MDGVALRKDLS